MKLFIHKIRKYKLRTISIILALVIVQGIVFFSVNMLASFKKQLFPETIFPIENLYKFKVLYDHPNTKPELVDLRFNRNLQTKIEAIDGLQNYSASALSPLRKEIYKHSLKNELDSVVKTFQASAGYGFEEIFPVKFLRGKSFCDTDSIKEIILTETLAKRLNLYNKKLPVIVSVPTNYVDNKWQNYALCGIIADLGYFNSENTEEEVYPLIIKSYSNHALVKLDNDADLFEIEKKFKQTVKSFTNNQEPIVEIMRFDTWVNDEWEDAKSMIIPVVSVIPIIILYVLIAMFGLFWTDVKRKTTDYGVMRAVGFSRGIIFGILFSEALFLAIVSGFISFLIVLNFKEDFKEFFKGLQGNLGIWIPLNISFLVVLFLVVLAVIAPAIRTMRIQPVEALAEE